mmetsp:Transcript_67334/g.147544  ORF Transcript_67334/g.147544 Transcript_67334/m.147544 type:complete len:243 (-) Transcript_67334:81-809(-)
MCLGSNSCGRLGRLDAGNGVLVGWCAEDSRASHQRVGTSLNHLVGIGRGDATVDLNPGVDTLGIAHGAQVLDLLHLRLDELLAAEARVDRHDEHQVHNIQHVLDRLQAGARVQHHTGLAAVVLDHVDDTVQVDGRLLLSVHRNNVGTSLGEVGDALLRLHNHQVAIQDLVRHRANGINDQGADGDVGHKAAIHHVDVHPIAASLINSLDLLAQLGKVSGQDGGRHDDIALGLGHARGLDGHR